jgi:hypothetical protein
VDPGLVLEPPDQKLEFSGFSLYSSGDFSDTPTRYLLKYARGYELLVGSILIAITMPVTLFALIGVSTTSRLPNPVPRSTSLPIAMWS